MGKKVCLAVAALLLVVPLAHAGYILKAFEVDGVTPYNGRALDVNDTLKLTIAAVDGDANDLSYFVLIADTTLASISGGTMHIPPAPDFSMIIDRTASENSITDLGNQDGIIGDLLGFSDIPPYPNGDYVTGINYQCKSLGDANVQFISIANGQNSIDPQKGAIVIDSLTIHQAHAVEPNIPAPTPAPPSHAQVLVYRIIGNLSGYTFDVNTNPATVAPLTARAAGYIVADVNTKTMYTNYFAAGDANNPVFIALYNNTYIVFSSSKGDPNVRTAFDLAQNGNKHFQTFSLLDKIGTPLGMTTVRPQFCFLYDSNSTKTHIGFYDGGALKGNLHLLNIGTTQANLPKYIKGKVSFDLSEDDITAGNIFMTLDKKYTNLANKNKMTVSATVNRITRDLQKKYKAGSASEFRQNEQQIGRSPQ